MMFGSSLLIILITAGAVIAEAPIIIPVRILTQSSGTTGIGGDLSGGAFASNSALTAGNFFGSSGGGASLSADNRGFSGASSGSQSSAGLQIDDALIGKLRQLLAESNSGALRGNSIAPVDGSSGAEFGGNLLGESISTTSSSFNGGEDQGSNGRFSSNVVSDSTGFGVVPNARLIIIDGLRLAGEASGSSSGGSTVANSASSGAEVSNNVGVGSISSSSGVTSDSSSGLQSVSAVNGDSSLLERIHQLLLECVARGGSHGTSSSLNSISSDNGYPGNSVAIGVSSGQSVSGVNSGNGFKSTSGLIVDSRVAQKTNHILSETGSGIGSVSTGLASTNSVGFDATGGGSEGDFTGSNGGDSGASSSSGSGSSGSSTISLDASLVARIRQILQEHEQRDIGSASVNEATSSSVSAHSPGIFPPEQNLALQTIPISSISTQSLGSSSGGSLGNEIRASFEAPTSTFAASQTGSGGSSLSGLQPPPARLAIPSTSYGVPAFGGNIRPPGAARSPNRAPFRPSPVDPSFRPSRSSSRPSLFGSGLANLLSSYVASQYPGSRPHRH